MTILVHFKLKCQQLDSQRLPLIFSNQVSENEFNIDRFSHKVCSFRKAVLKTFAILAGKTCVGVYF